IPRAWVARGDAGRVSLGFGVVGVWLGVTLGMAGSARAGGRPLLPSGKRQGAPIPQVALIDPAIEAGGGQAGIKPARPATDEEFLRRAYLDLLGRIPNVAEARAFLAARESGKRQKLVEHLLNHPDYAQNWATQWTILLIGRGNQGRRVDRA